MHVDGLIALLIIIGIVTSISKSGKKKKAAEAQKRAETPSIIIIYPQANSNRCLHRERVLS